MFFCDGISTICDTEAKKLKKNPSVKYPFGKIFIVCEAKTDVSGHVLCNLYINVQIVNRKLRLLHEIMNNDE